MLNWRRDPGFERRMNVLEKETEQIKNENERLRSENAKLAEINARGRALLCSAAQLCSQPDSSSTPPA